jgi:hypothetical protein
LAKRPLLGRRQIGVVGAGRSLGGGEADATQDRKGDGAGPNDLIHCCLLMSEAFGPVTLSDRNVANAMVMDFDKPRKPGER